MTSILRIDSGAAHPGSVTRQLADELVAKLSDESTTVVERDLSTTLPPAVTADWVAAARDSDAASSEVLASSDELIDELLAADTLVITVPIYNFGVPAALKLWIDQVARAGRTFAYTEAGYEGLIEGKRAYLVVASGGMPIDSAIDYGTPYLRHVLGFLGIADVQVIAAEGTALDAEVAVKNAREQLASVAA